MLLLLPLTFLLLQPSLLLGPSKSHIFNVSLSHLALLPGGLPIKGGSFSLKMVGSALSSLNTLQSPLLFFDE
jgi:hypothetical protein